MVNLLDIMRQAQSGTGVDALSRQFGLDASQTQRALEALLPAFALAFRRSAQDPGSFSGLLDLMMSGRFQPWFEGAGLPRAGGEDALRTLFGSPDVARQVAGQASAMTGIAVGVLQQMMPALAGMLVGGLFRFASLEGFADLLRHWSDALRAAAPRPAPPPRPADPWSAWFGMMSGMAAREPAPPPPPPTSASPFEAWARLMATMAGVREPPPPPPPPAAPNPFEALSRMFEAGREIQAQHLAAFGSILDGAARPPSRPA